MVFLLAIRLNVRLKEGEKAGGAYVFHVDVCLCAGLHEFDTVLQRQLRAKEAAVSRSHQPLCVNGANYAAPYGAFPISKRRRVAVVLLFGFLIQVDKAEEVFPQVSSHKALTKLD